MSNDECRRRALETARDLERSGLTKAVILSSGEAWAESKAESARRLWDCGANLQLLWVFAQSFPVLWTTGHPSLSPSSPVDIGGPSTACPARLHPPGHSAQDDRPFFGPLRSKSRVTPDIRHSFPLRGIIRHSAVPTRRKPTPPRSSHSPRARRNRASRQRRIPCARANAPGCVW